MSFIHRFKQIICLINQKLKLNLQHKIKDKIILNEKFTFFSTLNYGNV